MKNPIASRLVDVLVHSGSVQATFCLLQPPAVSWTLRLLTQFSLRNADVSGILPQGCYEKQNDVWKGSGRQKHSVKRQLVLVMLTVCDMESKERFGAEGIGNKRT